MANDALTVGSPQGHTLRVALVTDDRLLAEGVRRLAAEEESMTLFLSTDPSELGEGSEVLLLDSRMSAALELCQLLSRSGGPRVILVGAPDDEDWGVEAITAGARGILVRSAAPGDVMCAIRAVAGGVIWARRRVISTYIDRLTGAGGTGQSAAPQLDERLSVRERQIFHHAVAGLGNKELASRLAISEATVKVHLTHIFQKLGVRGRGELAAAYYRLLAPGSNAVRVRDVVE